MSKVLNSSAVALALSAAAFVVGIVCVGAVVGLAGMHGNFGAADNADGSDAEAYLAANRAEIQRQVLEDIDRFGIDIYRMYLEISQAMPGQPGSDFAVDKTVRKLEITYPDSNICRLAGAHVAYNAIRNRDMLQIERYLSNVEEGGGGSPLMPNGYEIVPQLLAAQYNYLFHIGRFAEAEQTLGYLAENFGRSYLFQPQGRALAIDGFVAFERKVLAKASEKAGGRK